MKDEKIKYNVIEQKIEIDNDTHKMILSFVFNENNISIVKATKNFSLSKAIIDDEWFMEFSYSGNMTGKQLRDMSFALMRLSDVMADFDYNIKKEIEIEDIKKIDIDNIKCYFPDGIEGYWRDKPKKDETGLPFPVINEENVAEYSKEDFLKALDKKESIASKVQFKGWSNCRLTGEANGSAEYRKNGWSWPNGYRNYIQKGVLPSRKFYKFITGKDLEELIDYHN